MAQLHREGVIEPTGDFGKTGQPSRNSAPVRFWKLNEQWALQHLPQTTERPNGHGGVPA
jgi:hypothetical protein